MSLASGLGTAGRLVGRAGAATLNAASNRAVAAAVSPRCLTNAHLNLIDRVEHDCTPVLGSVYPVFCYRHPALSVCCVFRLAVISGMLGLALGKSAAQTVFYGLTLLYLVCVRLDTVPTFLLPCLYG